MKRKIFSLTLTLLLGLFSWNATAATGWFSDYIKLNVNEAGVTPPTGYKWIGTDPAYGSSLVAGLGNVTSLKLDGADLKYWSDTQDRTGSSFFYQVTSSDGLTIYTAATEVVLTHTALGGNDFQGISSGLNVDLLAGVPAGLTGTACKLTVWAKSWGSGQGDSWLTNGGANYVATFTKTNVLLTGATGISNTGYTTLKGAFDAINANASGVNTDNVAIKVFENTSETATATLSNRGINTVSTSAGSAYIGPKISLTAGTNTAAGTIVTTVTNGVITSIVMTGGNYSVVPTGVTIGAGGSTGANGAGATATVTLSGTNLTFSVTNGGTGYGPTASFSGGGGGSGATLDVKLTTGATAPGSAPAGVGITYTLTSIGSGYTSAPACAISAFTGATAGTYTVTAVYAGTFGKLAIYPAVASKTISGAVGLISIQGCKNVAIDGRVNRQGTPAVGDAAGLTFSSTDATNPVIKLNSNAQNDSIQYCTLRGLATTNALGIVNLGTGASLTNGNGLNVIDHNLFTITTGSGTVPSYAIYAQGNMAFPNIGNKITNNEFKDLIAQYVSSTTLNILGGLTSPQNDNYTISGNSFYNSVQLDDYAATNLAKTIIGIGASSATFGGSHTITGNYIGGTAANCGGSIFKKTHRETTFQAMLLYPSPSVSGGGATSIQNNFIQKIDWENDYYPANWIGINIAGGTGDVNVGTVTGNTLGDNTTTGSIIVLNSSTSNASVTMLTMSTSGAINCQNNKIGSITASHTTANYTNTITCISKGSGAGSAIISNNVIGSTTQANSINNTSSGTTGSNIYGINCTGTGTNTINNNTIANLLNTTTVGSIFTITTSGAGSTNTINGNLMHSIGIGTTATTATIYGIWMSGGTTTVSNNILKLGNDNACEIRGLGDGSAATLTKVYNNTVYVIGSPSTLALSSAALFSSGQTTKRYYKNNIAVNTRSNTGTSTSVHYAFNANSISGAGVILSDANCYWAPGVGGKIGRFSSDKTTMPVVTGHDSTSVNVDPVLANAVTGTTAPDFIPMAMLGVNSTGITKDYTGVTTRAVPSIGAYEVLPTVTLSPTSLTGLNGTPGAPASGYQQSFAVSGTNLAGSVVLTAPTDYQISTVGDVGFTPTSPITLTRTGTSLSSTTIYVRSAAISSGTYNNENITVVVPGSSQNVTCSGVVDITVGAKTALSDGLRIINANGQVNITGAKAGQLIEVYNASGARMSSTIATDGDNRLTLPSKGFQLIKVGTEVRKVMVK